MQSIANKCEARAWAKAWHSKASFLVSESRWLHSLSDDPVADDVSEPELSDSLTDTPSSSALMGGGKHFLHRGMLPGSSRQMKWLWPYCQPQEVFHHTGCFSVSFESCLWAFLAATRVGRTCIFSISAAQRCSSLGDAAQREWAVHCGSPDCLAGSRPPLGPRFVWAPPGPLPAPLRALPRVRASP